MIQFMEHIDCHGYSPMIQGSEITLVKPRLDLADDVRNALMESYDEHSRYLTWAEPNPSLETVTQNIEQAIHNFENDVNEYRFFILRNSDSRLVGTVGLLIKNLQIPYLEIGYWVRSSESGKGYIGKAVQMLEDYAINKLEVRRLEIRTAESNIRSKRVAERAGFKLEARIQSDRTLPDGTIENSLIYCKLYP
jgi:ribosomal-protein-serine acetyltransferase